MVTVPGTSQGISGPLRWALVNLPLADGAASGDSCLVTSHQGAARVAVIDGLGHGDGAALAARAAVEALRARPDAAPPEALEICDLALARTRGAVVSVARVVPGVVAWCGVGDVDGAIVHASGAPRVRRRLVTTPGVVGAGVGTPPLTRVLFERGDVLALWTDGLGPELADALRTDLPLVDLAQRLMREHRSGRDDALVFVARLLEAW